MKKYKSIALVTAGLLAFSGSSVVAVKMKNAPLCRIEVSYPHMSTSLIKNKGIRAVKINAYSTCNRPHSRITLTVEIWKEGLFLKEKLFSTTERRSTPIPAYERFYNNSTFIPCQNRELTRYYGVAYAKALIGDKWHYARDQLDIEFKVIPCGT